ncbi:TPA: EAL domain-containing protein [Klebsiella oxytoca]
MFYVPAEPFHFLLTLMHIADGLRTKSTENNFIFISSVPCGWLHRCLLQMTRGESLAFSTRIVSSDLSVDRLEQYFERVLMHLPFTSGENMPYRRGRAPGEGLTPRETEALLDLFSETGQKQVKKNRKVAIKSLYNNRKSGLRKMIENSAELARQLSGSARRWRTALPQIEMSSGEKDFLAGVDMQEVYHVYQPIVDTYRTVVGFEILTRWRRKGIDVLPDKFLPELKNERVLLLLTALSLKSAIDGINRFRGTWFFSVNIHAGLHDSQRLVSMCAEACCQLREKSWKNRLILEYSEISDCYRTKGIVTTVVALNRLGLRVYLDDCFSGGSGFFPVRSIPFAGYKLDKSIVDNVLMNKDDMALVTALSGYCSMTGRQCIAEGVEDGFTFEKLKKLGVELFQGHFFHRPLSLEALPSLLST